ncbi:MAG: IS1182 family transposase [Elusimicrobiota bacterium]
MNYIQPQNREQIEMMSMEMLIAPNNEVRVLDAFVEALNMKQLGFCEALADEGRPPFHPATMLKLYLYGYMNRVRSSRRLEKECERNIEVKWLLGNIVPNYHSIADFRKEHSSQFKAVFRLFVIFLRGENLLGKKTVGIDGSKFRAVNSKKNNYNEKKIKKHLAYIENKAVEYMQELDRVDAEENNKKEKFIRTQTAVDAQNNLLVHYEATNRNDAKALHKAATEAKEILQSEELTVLADKGYHNGEQLSQCEKENIVTVVAYREQPSVKHLDKKYLVENFRYNKKNDTYTCPQGHTLRSNGNWYKKNHRSEKRKTGGITEVKHYKTPHCKNCPVLNQCTKNTRGRGRVIERSKHQDAVDRNNHRVKTQRELYNRRQTICEHPFGTIKRAWGYTYTLLKGLKKVDGEFGIIFTCYNLRRTISIMGVEKLLKKLKKWKPDYKKAMKSRGNNFLFTKTASLSRITALQNFSYQLAA